MKHTYIYIVLFLLLLAGCEHDRSIFDGDLVPVRIIPSLDEAAPAGTRVVDQQWQSSDVVGVSIDDTNYKEYTPSATGTSVTLTSTDPLYYPSTGTVTFRAFCPYKAPSDNVVTYDAFTNQSTSALMQAVDLVYHYGATGSKSTAETSVELNFKHKFSKIVIIARKGAGVTDAFTGLTMTLGGMPTSVTFDLSTGTSAAPTGSEPILPEHYGQTADIAYAHAILPPHAGKGGRTITFAVGSLNYSYTIPDTQKFDTGMAYTFDFTLTGTAPSLTGTEITAWNGGTIAWDGTGNSLTAPAEVTHYKEASTGNTIVIKTNHTATPGLTYNSLSWLKNPVLSGPTDTPKTYILTYNVDANTGGDRTGTIDIAVGGMKVSTTVTQKGTSYPATHVDGNTNCFIVTPGTAIKFSLSRPISQGTANSSSVFTVDELWDDATGGAVSSVSVDGTGSNAMVTVIAGNSPGNALVAAKVGTTIVWSYHIWVTDYNPYATTYKNTNNGLIFMDRNLGATTVGKPASSITVTSNTTGLYYQWGRKDPFPNTGYATTDESLSATPVGGSGSFSVSPAYVTSSTGTIDYAIKNPNVFLKATNTSTAGDWHYGSTGADAANRNNELWGHSGAKTAYDPCPAGWRVPRYTSGTGTISDATSPWRGFTTAATWTVYRGRDFGINAYYQASGRRRYDSGALDNVGGHGEYGGYGYCWSASPYSLSSGSSAFLYFNYTAVSLTYGDYRAFGYSVRCVQE